MSRLKTLRLLALLVAHICVATVGTAQSQNPQLPAGVTSGAASQQTFHITPLKPVAELRREALRATPPLEAICGAGEAAGSNGCKRAPALVELVKLDPTIHLDIRYASSNNFMGTPFYTEARAFLERPAAEAVVRANAELKRLGYGLLVHDGYRPWFVTKMFWEGTPDGKKKFVADPDQGSRHNRGCAVDITLYDLKSGREVAMPSGYDEMSERAYPSYRGGTAEQRRLRDLLRAAMEKQGFAVFPVEWWHFDYKDWKQYPIMNVRFEDLGK